MEEGLFANIDSESCAQGSAAWISGSPTVNESLHGSAEY